MLEEEWQVISEFPSYQISTLGRIYNERYNMMMRTTPNNHGHMRISLVSDRDGQRYTRSVAQLVGEAFVEPPNGLADQPVLLDGDFSNVSAQNIVWRPRWFAWRYAHQLKTRQPRHYQNLHVLNLDIGIEYESVVQCGMLEGLLFDEIWESTYTGKRIYPYGHTYKIV